MNKEALIKDLNEVYNLVSDHDIIEAMERLEFVISEVKQLHIPVVSNSTPLEQLFYKCKQDDPTMTKEEFNEALELWLYRWEKDQQIKQMRNKQ